MMVTANAAAAVAMSDKIGLLAAGKVADVSIFNGKTHKDFRAILERGAGDVVLVLRGGKVLYGDDPVVTGIPNTGACDPVTGDDATPVCGVAKRICVQADIGKTFAQLKTSAGALYAAYFCGAPDNEAELQADAAELGRRLDGLHRRPDGARTRTATASPTRWTTAPTSSTRSGPA